MTATPSDKKVLVVGELNMDLILSDIPDFPELDKEILASNMTLTLGSSSAIFASNLAVLGSKVSFVGKIGDDPFGEQILLALSGKDVDTEGIVKDKELKTGLTVSLNYGNQKANITYSGAMEDLAAEDIPDEVLKKADHLHISSIFMQPRLKTGLLSLLQRAKSRGMTTSIDPQWDPSEKWDVDWEQLLPLTDFFMPNINELNAITKKTNTDDALRSMKDFCKNIIVKMGTEGSIAFNRNEQIFQSAYINNNVKDTVGAGDTFNAGFIHQYLKGSSLQKCLELGSVCAAVSTTSYGGTNAFKNKKDIKETAKNQFNYIIDDM